MNKIKHWNDNLPYGGVGVPQLYNNLLIKAFHDYDYILLQWMKSYVEKN